MKIQLAILAACCCGVAFADDASDEAGVIAVIQDFFSAMAARDADRLGDLMTEDGMIYGYRETEDGLDIFRQPNAGFIDNVAGSTGVPLERFWSPQVLVHDRIATVWTPYDFHRDGEFSHCGINNFSLIKSDAGWIVTGVVFSMQTTDCEGPPAADRSD